MKKFLFSIIFISSLFACNNDLPLDNFKEEKKEDKFIVRAEIDNEYEYADDHTRYIGITADDAPRVVLEKNFFPTNADINKHDKGISSLRVLFMAFKYTNSNSVYDFSHVDEYDALPNTLDIISISGGKGNYTIYLDRKDKKDRAGVFQPWSNAVWSMALIIGGYQGGNGDKNTIRDYRMSQWFTKYGYGSNQINTTVINRHPNEKIVQIIGNNYTRRHFPLVSRFYPAKIDRKAPDGVNWGKWDEPNKDNLYIGRDNPIKIEPRGTIFTFRFKNETGKNIKVTHIESPYYNGFEFEGYFDGTFVNPIKSDFGNNKNFDPSLHWDSDEARIPFMKFAQYPNEQYGSFPVYEDETTAGYIMAPNQTSEGKFLVWAYPMDGGTTRFRVRVRYEVVGEAGSHESVAMEVPLPASGSYEDGKAYRSMLIIK